MAMIYLKIRAGVRKLSEAYISGRIRAILDETGAPADISGNMWHDYTISDIAEGLAPAVCSRLEKEPGFEPYPDRGD
jgi:hypothetical protein